MKTNKLDNSIKEKLVNRTIEPSVSAWERLSLKLDEQPKHKKKGWFFYTGYAASILMLISVGIYTFSEDEQVIIPKQIIVEVKIDTMQIKNKIEQHFNTITNDKAIVKSEKVEKKKDKFFNVKNTDKNLMEFKEKSFIITKDESFVGLNIIPKNKEKISTAKSKEKNPIVILTKEASNNKIFVKHNLNSRIKVNAANLLYVVTNESNKVEDQYASHNTSREEILKTIKSELKKSNLKVNPETILAEVERTINKDVFQNNFLKSLKKRISNIATAIASRNN